MGGTQYGYVRVSSKDQNIARQLTALADKGIAKENIFTDKKSGKDFLRPQYKKLMKKLKSGDCLIITSLDRLGRNYTEIIEQWGLINKKKKADIVVLDMPLLDTRRNNKNLTGMFLSDIVLQILSYVAETERMNIKKRQAEGIAAAKARGVKFGRTAKPLPKNYREILAKWKKFTISTEEAAHSLGHTSSWLYRYDKRGKKE